LFVGEVRGYLVVCGGRIKFLGPDRVHASREGRVQDRTKPGEKRGSKSWSFSMLGEQLSTEHMVSFVKVAGREGGR
jgi:hypothetical protein